MTDSQILQAILNGQAQIRDTVKKLEEIMIEQFKVVSQRLEKIGLSLANLEDDTPTVEQFDKLEKRVKKLERQVLSA